MKEKYSVKLTDIVKEQGLSVVHVSKNFSDERIYTSDVNRPALQLAGFYDYFDPKRIQAMGRVESTYLESLPADARRHALEEFMKFDIAALIVCHGVQPFPESIEMAEKYDRNLFVTDEDTSTFMADLISSLRNSLRAAHDLPRRAGRGVRRGPAHHR
jgi:HPr kinase/phosphorylase